MGNTDRLCKLDPKRVASKRKTLKCSHGINSIFIPLEVNESIAAAGLERHILQRPELREMMSKLILPNVVGQVPNPKVPRWGVVAFAVPTPASTTFLILIS